MMPPALGDAQASEAALLYCEHDWPVSDLAEHFGVSETAVKTALQRLNVSMRARVHTPPNLRIKQCARCLHFLPLALFSGTDASRRRLASWCNNCTNQPSDPKWHLNVPPLARAIQQWRPQ